MPRIARKNLSSSYMHIIVQGINKEYIFSDNHLKDAYKSILKKNLSKTNINILAYCIMNNHAHILVHSTNIQEITKLMQKTNTSYAKLYNKNKQRVGYVFRNRYYSQMILDKNHLYNCIAYIHNNPVKANIVNKLSSYLYSSYSEYLGNKDLITETSIKLAFDNINNYIETFKQIHKNENIEDIIDVMDEIKESSQIIENFLSKYHKTLQEIINDNNIFSELLLQLRHLSGLSLRDLSKIFNINKDKLNKIINKNL